MIGLIKSAPEILPRERDGTCEGKLVRITFRSIAIILGGLHAWAAATSYSMNADGISYLDIADAYIRGDWQAAISPVWSPMYSWFLGIGMWILDPPMRWEFATVHLVNFLIYIIALACFEFFWRQLGHYCEMRKGRWENKNSITIPAWAWLSLGYIVFMFCSLQLIEMWSVTPDMLMSAFVYLAAGLVVRIRMGSASHRTVMLLGLMLGASVWAKAVMLPLGFIFLAITVLSISDIRRGLALGSVGLAAFLLVSAPFVGMVSYANGELTFGDAGVLTYVKHVNGLTYPHWQGEPPENGTPIHPSRKILDDPPIYEFGNPIGGTYPIGYNPSYWYKGVLVRFDLEKQLNYLLISTLFYGDLFFRQQGALLFGIVVLYMMAHWQQLRLLDIISGWGLVIIAFAAFAFYGLVNVIGRYVGVFVALFWGDMLANVRLADSAVSKRLVSGVSIAMIIFMLANMFVFNIQGFRDLRESRNGMQGAGSQGSAPSWPGEVAEELHRLGVDRGDKVALIGYGFDSYWARLARVKIVAEMLDSEAIPFWVGESSVRSKVIEAFASAGAKAIVAENVPSYASLNPWHRVGKSNYYIYKIGR